MATYKEYILSSVLEFWVWTKHGRIISDNHQSLRKKEESRKWREEYAKEGESKEIGK